jgi:deoxyribose-phosphate aldolase
MESPVRPAPATYEELAPLVKLPLVKPELTAAQVHEGLQMAKRYGISCVTVRPCDIDLAVRALQGSAVRPGAVAGFPHGSSGTAVKLYEVRDLLRRGAKEIGMVVAIPKLVSREFPYVQTELLQASEACHKEGAALTVILESVYLTDEMKIVACRCAERAEVDAVATSTGLMPSGNILHDIRLLRQHLPEEAGIEAAGDIDTVERVLELHEAGCTRFATTSAFAILEAWKARIAANQQGTEQTPRSVS